MTPDNYQEHNDA